MLKKWENLAQKKSQLGVRISKILRIKIIKILYLYYHKNISVNNIKVHLLYFLQQNHVMLFKFIQKNNSLEKKISIQQIFFFSFLKKFGLKIKKKMINVNHTTNTIVLIKMRPLIFLVFSPYGLASKCGIILQISIYTWRNLANQVKL